MHQDHWFPHPASLQELASHITLPDMDKTSTPLQPAPTLAVLYLVAPLYVFFAFFIRWELAVPACAVMTFLIYELISRTAWRSSTAIDWQPLYFLMLAALWVWSSGGFGGVHQNDDWNKHYQIINFLTQHTWPATDQFQEFGNSALRYYIGWYLVPALVLRSTNPDFQTLATAVWSTLGVSLFFNLLPGIVGKRWAAVAAPLVFVVFGGADVLGALITKAEPILPFHNEWWAGWIQYSSNTTSLFWVPQHAIPAWLGVAILMRWRDRPEFLRYCAFMTSAILLWSPFSAIGLTPFLLALLVQHGARGLIMDLRSIVSVLLLSVPVALYLTAGSGTIPHGFIGKLPCLEIVPWKGCFTWPTYPIFLVIEIGAPLAMLFLRREREQGFVVASAIALLALPLYKFGAMNDLSMRASLPALAVLAILSAKLLTEGRKTYAAAVILILAAATPNVLGEMYRGFIPGAHVPPNNTVDMGISGEGGKFFYAQYFAPLPIWVLEQ
jgi:hypothetical protein